MLQKLFLQGSACLDEERAVDGFVRHLHILCARVSSFEPSGYLLGRPLTLQFTRHNLCQLGIASQLARLWAACSLPGRLVCLCSSVASFAAIAQEFTADGGRCAFQTPGNAADGFTCGQAARYLLAFAQRQGQTCPVSCRRSDATRSAQDSVKGGVRSVKQLADLVQGIASFPAIPHQGLLRFGVVNPRSLLHANTPSARGGHCVALTS